jgi:hypothetical protein
VRACLYTYCLRAYVCSPCSLCFRVLSALYHLSHCLLAVVLPIPRTVAPSRFRSTVQLPRTCARPTHGLSLPIVLSLVSIAPYCCPSPLSPRPPTSTPLVLPPLPLPPLSHLPPFLSLSPPTPPLSPTLVDAGTQGPQSSQFVQEI